MENNEEKILEFWKKNKIFEKSLKKTEKDKPYIFYDGPPFATGLPHYGHILASVLKDAFPRFWTMKNRYVRRIWGWDCHGLPVENIAEKELGIKTKNEIEKMGVEKFNKFCRSKVLTYASEWKKIIEKTARWVDFDNSYKTMDNEYIESVWWAFKEIYNKGLIYEGEKILMYCPRCETPLSKSEIAMDNSYKKVKDKSITVKFKLKNSDIYALAWTTTPWTLSSNLALTVSPDLIYSYVKDKSDKTIYLLAKDLIEKYFKDKKEYEIIKEIKGKELKGIEYLPLFDYFKEKNAFKILTGDFVTAEEGTGIVHTAPGFGEEDYNVCKENNIDLVMPVDNQGKFTEEIFDFEGEYIFDSNNKIIDKLKKENKIVKIENTEHEYPFCYRCETPLLYKAIPSWFINIQKIKSKILKLNKKINWYPEFLKEGRFQKSVESAPDWNISRNRYWASAIPIWKCECGKIKVIGGIDELKKESSKKIEGKIDLHKDFLDKINLKCCCGKDMERIPEVLDCWFESGSMTFAQFHYPFENKKFFDENFPAQFVAEYIGQVRAWFYYTIVLSTILFEKIPFENILTTGTILAEDGSKMSKSKKNFPDPLLIFEKYGVDSLRFYLLSSPVMNADNFNFSEKGVEEIFKKVIIILKNTLRFYELNKKNFGIEDPKSENLLDKWIISRLNQLTINFENYFKKYNTIKTCNEIKEFINDFSTWYVRATRERINNNDEYAIKTMSYVLDILSKVSAPIIPFISEEIYQSLHGKKESVHLENWPNINCKKIDNDLIEKMKECRKIVSSGLKERDIAKIGLKWPLKKAKIISNILLNEDYLKIIKEELNVKEIEMKIEKDKEIKVELDFDQTPELESEGYARELSRFIQAFRKNLGLKKEDEINLKILTDKKLIKIIEPKKDDIMLKTNSKKMIFIESSENIETFKNKKEFVIKDKKGEMIIF